MTHHHTPPEDAFDRWLDALVDEEHQEIDDDRAGTAAFLQRHFALPPTDLPVSDTETDTAPSRQSPPATSSPRRLGILPPGSAGAGGHVASLASAAVVALITLATIVTFLRLDANQHGEVSATASMLPFAPASALASPTPTGCPTKDTLLLVPEDPVAPDAFADLAFPVAWYAGDTVTVERAGEILRTIDIGTFPALRPTHVPNVIHAFAQMDGGSERAAFINIATGATVEIGAYQRIVFSDGPYAFWVSDDAHTHWHAIDLRSFETADLNERFAIAPLRAWTPWVSRLTSSDDGTVMLVGTATHDIVNRSAPRATPIASDGPEIEIGRSALLIEGSLDTISAIGPVAPTSGDMTVSADGKTVAWLAPSGETSMRTLMIQTVASGDVIAEHSIDVTYSNSLLFSADGSALFSTSGSELAILPIDQKTVTPAAATDAITLPDTSYRIVGASPDRTKLLLTRHGHAADERAIWLNLDTGETRELRGQPARMWVSAFPAWVASPIGPYMLIDDHEQTVDVVTVASGETIMTVDRANGAGAITTSAGHDTLVIPRETTLDFLDLSTGIITSHPVPEEIDGFATPLTFSLTSEGSCLAGTWWLDDGARTVLLSATSDRSASLPPSTVGGWISSDAP